MTAIIYMIKDLEDAVLYIGSTKNYQSRKWEHKSNLKKFPDRKLYHIINAIGGWDFILFEVIFEVILNQRYEWEQLAFDYYKPIGNIDNPTWTEKCPHNKHRYVCGDCGGKGWCIHDMERANCKDCLGNSICSHDKRKRLCKICAPVECPVCLKIYSKHNLYQHLKTHMTENK